MYVHTISIYVHTTSVYVHTLITQYQYTCTMSMYVHKKVCHNINTFKNICLPSTRRPKQQLQTEGFEGACHMHPPPHPQVRALVYLLYRVTVQRTFACDMHPPPHPRPPASQPLTATRTPKRSAVLSSSCFFSKIWIVAILCLKIENKPSLLMLRCACVCVFV